MEKMEAIQGKQDRIEAELAEKIEEGLVAVEKELTKKINRSQTDMRSLASEVSVQVFESKIPVALAPIERAMGSFESDMNQLRTDNSSLSSRVEKGFVAIQKDVDQFSRQLNAFEAKFESFSKFTDEFKTQMQEQKKAIS